jgi:hypothetical protein
VVQTDVKGEMGATLERMGGEEGILPERSEWFHSMPVIRSCRSCPDGAASLVCHFANALPTFQHDLSLFLWYMASSGQEKKPPIHGKAKRAGWTLRQAM